MLLINVLIYISFFNCKIQDSKFVKIKQEVSFKSLIAKNNNIFLAQVQYMYIRNANCKSRSTIL